MINPFFQMVKLWPMNLSFELASAELQPRARNSTRRSHTLLVRDQRTQAIVRRFNLGGATLTGREVANKAVTAMARFAEWVAIPAPALDQRDFQLVSRCDAVLL